MKSLLFSFGLLGIIVTSSAQVGIGTDQPNARAVLDLKSPGNNQGFLAPRLTTQQRNATTFTTGLTAAENGLLVFDTEDRLFYYWMFPSWRALTAGSGASLWRSGDDTPANTLGNDGDYYLDNISGDVFQRVDGVYVFATNLKGPKGDKGDTGNTGPQGAIGLTGAIGPQGPAGPKGDKGDTGDTGPQGPIGLTGSQGATGPKGDKGDTGETGEQGPIGLTGAQGPAGTIGPQGPAGPQGDKGDTGDAGAPGPIGLTGPTGPQGDKGDTGNTGPQGPIGLTGAQGPAGATGTQGPIGLTGPQGEKGDQGDVGPVGAAGVQGPLGPIGPAGPTGPQGEKGDQGDVGPVGATGAQGPIGLTGATGPQGPEGPQGTQGPTGASGSSNLNVRIITKFEDEALDKDDILIVNTTGSATIYIPDAESMQNKVFYIRLGGGTDKQPVTVKSKTNDAFIGSGGPVMDIVLNGSPLIGITIVAFDKDSWYVIATMN